MIDLGAIERMGLPPSQRQRVAALVAEARAARRLIRETSRPHCSQNCPCALNQAWVAYDEATADEAIAEARC